jgi:hypothetical protein
MAAGLPIPRLDMKKFAVATRTLLVASFLTASAFVAVSVDVAPGAFAQRVEPNTPPKLESEQYRALALHRVETGVTLMAGAKMVDRYTEGA